MNRFALILLVGALAASPSYAAGEQSSALVTNNVNQTWVVQKGSSTFNRIRSFLLQQSSMSRSYGASNLALERLGNFTVQISSHSTSGVIPNDESNPPATPPDGGSQSDGDTWSVSTCSGGVKQVWTWTYESDGQGGGSWVLTGYTYNVTRLCGAPTG